MLFPSSFLVLMNGRDQVGNGYRSETLIEHQTAGRGTNTEADKGLVDPWGAGLPACQSGNSGPIYLAPPFFGVAGLFLPPFFLWVCVGESPNATLTQPSVSARPSITVISFFICGSPGGTAFRIANGRGISQDRKS